MERIIVMAISIISAPTTVLRVPVTMRALTGIGAVSA